MRVSDHVYVLSGSYYGAVNNQDVLGDVYGIRTDEGLILIDCGIEGAGPARIKRTLSEYGIVDPVAYVILTHTHFDHAGGAREFQDAGAKIIVGEEDAANCRAGGCYHLGSPFENQVYHAFEPDICIAGDTGMKLCGLPLMFYRTPGHTRGSLSIYAEIDGKIMLFTGDALQPEGRQIDQVSFGWQGDLGFSRSDIVESMRKLSSLRVDMVLPGHGKLCVDNGSELLKFAYRQALLTLR